MKPLQLIKPDGSLEDEVETGITGYTRGSLLQGVLASECVPSPQQPGEEDMPQPSGGRVFMPFMPGISAPPSDTPRFAKVAVA
ncbi:MAG: hypothetical protein WA323_19960 [Candidatus Nitrosopolaris sp.]